MHLFYDYPIENKKDKTRNMMQIYFKIKEVEQKTLSLKKPRSESAQQKVDDKLKAQIKAMEEMSALCEQTILGHCHYTLVGENAMGKILTVLRDNNGKIDYDIKYPLFLLEHEII